MIKTANEAEVERLRLAFEEVDINGTGLIKATQLRDVLV